MPLGIEPWRRLPVLFSLPLAAETTENLCQNPMIYSRKNATRPLRNVKEGTRDGGKIRYSNQSVSRIRLL